MVREATHTSTDAASSTVWNRMLDALLSLQFKATTLVVILTLLVTAGVSGFLLQTSGQLARAQHDEQLVNAAALLAKAANPLWVDGDLNALKGLAVESANGLPLLYVIFSDVEGKQVAVAEHRSVHLLQRLERDGGERVPVPGTPVFHPESEEAPVFLDVTYPVNARPAAEDESSRRSTRLLGYVRTGMVANHWQRTMSSRLDLVVGVGLLATLAAIPLGFLLVRKIVSPLDGLTASMAEFSHGKLDVRSPVTRRDEIGKLAMAFNRMADLHQQTHERIVRLNADLEERVAFRTQQLRELASREPLTGLYNRRYFNEMLERRFAEAARYNTDMSCLMIDLDEFKAVNDQFGHQIGDELLVLTADTLTGHLRTADLAARLGGDEFVVLLPQTDADQARVLGERIAEQFNNEVAARLPGVRTSMSIGIANLQALEVKDAESLIRLADHAMYDAKIAGRNRIVTGSATAKSTSA